MKRQGFDQELLWSRIICKDHTVGETIAVGVCEILAFLFVLRGLVTVSDPVEHCDSQDGEQEGNPGCWSCALVGPEGFILLVKRGAVDDVFACQLRTRKGEDLRIAGYKCAQNRVTMMSQLYLDGSCERSSDRLMFLVEPNSRVGPGSSGRRKRCDILLVWSS